MLGDGNGGMSTIPGFNQIQFEGFCRFIDQGLTEELSKFPKIEDTNQEIDFELFLERYQLPAIFYFSNFIKSYCNFIFPHVKHPISIESCHC